MTTVLLKSWINLTNWRVTTRRGILATTRRDVLASTTTRIGRTILRMRSTRATSLQSRNIMDIFDGMLEFASLHNDLALVGINNVVWKVFLGKVEQLKGGRSKVFTDRNG